MANMIHENKVGMDYNVEPASPAEMEHHAASILPVHEPNAWNYAKQGIDWQDNPSLCNGSKRQSPIDIIESNIQASHDVLKLYYKHCEKAFVKFNGAAVQCIPAANDSFGSCFMKKGENPIKRFDIPQFHFHAPSEHTFDSNRRGLELHVVHRNPDKTMVVLGVTFVEGKENEMLQRIIDADFKSFEGKKKKEISDFCLNDLIFQDDIPHDTNAYVEKDYTNINKSDPGLACTYNGSLTTPPCTESVTWFLKVKPTECSKAQLDIFTEYLRFEGTDGNYRCLQNTKENMRNSEVVYWGDIMVMSYAGCLSEVDYTDSDSDSH